MAGCLSMSAVALAGILLLGVRCWAYAQDYAGITVHVVFSNHLDVGFTQLDNETLNAYFHDHIPRAIWLAEWLKLSGSNDSFIWTTHPWLLSLYLECPEQLGVVCPSSQQQDAVRAAIKKGVITWHAAPFNLQWEMLPAPAAPPPPAAAAPPPPPPPAAAAPPSAHTVKSTRTNVRTLQASWPPSRQQHQVAAGGAQQTRLDSNSMLSATLDISRRLDRGFGVTPKTVVSLRDVPGLTRSAVPHLVAAGIKAITVGVNGGSAPPAVPLNAPFLWRDNVTDTQLLAMWHAGGYGGQCRDATSPPDAPELQVGCHDECVSAPGLNHVMCFSWRSDNQGPAQDTLEVAAVMRTVRQQWPGATVQISTLDAFVKQLAEAVAKGRVELPVVTGEVGDTWVYGVSSDPLKISRYRAAARARRRACEVEQACGDIQQSGALARFDRLLLKVPEHTWGLDVKSTLSYFNTNYSNEHLHLCMTRATASNNVAAESAISGHGSTAASRVSSGIRGGLSADVPGCEGTSRLTHSWMRQAAYVDWALQELPCNHVLVHHYTSDMTDMATLAHLATKPQGHKVLSKNGHQMQEFASHAWLISVDTKTGFITKLCRFNSSNSGRPHCSSTDWAAGRDSLFAVPLYVVHKASDYNIVWNEYAWEGPPHLNPWFMMDFGKTGLSDTWDKHIEALPNFKAFYHTNTPDQGLTLQLHYTLPQHLHRQAGAPASLVIIIQSKPGDTSLRLSLVWLDKTPTRLPESLWLRFELQDDVAVDANSWRLHKLGQAVSPHEVILNGSHSMHAVDDVTGVSVAAAVQQQQVVPKLRTSLSRDVLHLTPVDSPLMSPGQPLTLPNVRHQPDMREGVAFNLHNNMWGTNYVMWLPYQPPKSTGAPHYTLWPHHCNADTSMGSQFDADVLARLANQRTSVFRFKVNVVGSNVEARPPSA